MIKFSSLNKKQTKIITIKRNLEFNDLKFLCYSTKADPELSEFI